MADVDLDHGDIDQTGSANQGAAPLRAIRQGNGDPEGPGDDVFVGNDDAGRVHDETSADIARTLRSAVLVGDRLNGNVDDTGD